MWLDGVPIPEPVRPWIGWAVGMDWPEADEAVLFRLADDLALAFHRINGGARGDGRLAGGAADGAERGDWDGEALRTFVERVDRETAGRKDVLLSRLAGLALACNDLGVQVQFTKRMIKLSVLLLIVQLAWLMWAMLSPASGVAWAAAGARAQATRLAIRQLAKRLLFNVALFGTLTGGMDLYVQATQSRRDEIDMKQVGWSALSGAFTGVALSLSTGLLPPRTVLGLMGHSAVAGGGATLATMLLSDQPVDWEMVAKGTTAGALGGADAHWASWHPHGGHGSAFGGTDTGTPHRAPDSTDPTPPRTPDSTDPGTPPRTPDGTDPATPARTRDGDDPTPTAPPRPQPADAPPPRPEPTDAPGHRTPPADVPPPRPEPVDSVPGRVPEQATPHIEDAVPDHRTSLASTHSEPIADRVPPTGGIDHLINRGGSEGNSVNGRGGPSEGGASDVPGPAMHRADPMRAVPENPGVRAVPESAPASAHPQSRAGRPAIDEAINPKADSEGPEHWNDGGWEDPPGAAPEEHVPTAPEARRTSGDVLQDARDALAQGDVSRARAVAEEARAHADQLPHSPPNVRARALYEAIHAERIAHMTEVIQRHDLVPPETLRRLQDLGLNLEVRLYGEHEKQPRTTYDPETNTLYVNQTGRQRSPGEELAAYLNDGFHDGLARREFTAQEITDWPGLNEWSEGAARPRTKGGYDDWVDQHMTPQGERLTDAQKASLYTYRMVTAYTEINQPLRGYGELSPEMAQHVADIDAAMLNSVIPEDVVVGRQVGPDAFDRPVYRLEGTTQRDPAYLSTSTDKNPPWYLHMDSGALVKIWLRVPAGTHAVHMRGLHPLADLGVGPTTELLLGRGTRYRVDKVLYEDGHYKVFATVVGQEG